MEKLPSRPSGGGGTLRTLDMQSYLEVMGRQLAEIQEQHTQFYAKRPDRQGRTAALRSQEDGSGLDGDSPHQGDYTPPEGRTRASAANSHGTQGGRDPTSGDSRDSRAVVANAPAQGGARRSLSFAAAPRDEGVGGRERREGVRRTKDQPGLRTSNSSPLALGGRSSSMGVGPAPAAGMAGSRSRVRMPSAGSAAPRSRRSSSSYSVPISISPSSASLRPQSSVPGTPSTCSARPTATPPTGATAASQPYTSPSASPARTAASSPVGPYAVYDASGDLADRRSYGSPYTHDGSSAHPASASSGFRVAPRSPVDRAAASSAAAPGARQPSMPMRFSPFSASTESSALAAHDGARRAGGGAVSEDEDEGEGLLYPLALAGQAYDGVDSEEDCDSDAAGGVHAADGGGQARPSSSGTRAPAAAAPAAAAAPSQPGPQRLPLVAASLETEEALRALLASPRFGGLGPRGGVGASFDAEGVEVPDDVLAALASVDGRGLDAVLGAAAVATLREHAAGAQGAGASSRPATQARGSEPGGNASLSRTAQGRQAPAQPLLGGGGLTAAPVAMPSAAGARGAPAKRLAPAAAMAAAEGCVLGQPDVAIDVSFDAAQFSALGRTLEFDGPPAAQQEQPVLYSLTSRAPPSGEETTSRRTTAEHGVLPDAVVHPAGAAAADGRQRPPADGAAPPMVSMQLGRDPGARPLAPPPRPTAAAQRQGAPYGSFASAGLSPPSPAFSGPRPGGDGDSVLYASPSGKLLGADGAAVPPSPAPSPYVPPSPPPGADPSPYLTSPSLHTSLRQPAEAPGRPRSGARQDVGSLPATVGVGSVAARVPAAPATASSSGRKAGVQLSAAGNNGSFDLSLAQAAAASSSCSMGRPSPLATGAVPAPAPPNSLGRNPRTPALQALRPQEAPAYSSCSLAALSPAAGATAVSSYDLEVDDVGHPISPSPSPGSHSQLVHAAKVGHAAGPPLAALSRAAAIAAAADVGWAGPPARTAASDAAAAVGEGGASAGAAASSGARAAEGGVVDHRPAPGDHHMPYSRAAQAPSEGGERRAAAAVARAVLSEGGERHLVAAVARPERGAAGDDVLAAMDLNAVVDGFSGGLRLGAGQSPAPASATATGAKLTQLKARRQQQWQSQLGTQGGRSTDQTPAAGQGSASPRHPQSDAAATCTSYAPLPAVATPASLPTAVLEAIARAASSGRGHAESGEFNLGHGITGLSVAIEAGQVKWAWQTGMGGDHTASRGVDASAPGYASPGGSTSSAWASPGADRALDAWAQLPTPQWQRQDQQPTGPRAHEHAQGDRGGHAPPPQQPEGGPVPYSPGPQLEGHLAGEHEATSWAPGRQEQQAERPGNSKSLALLRLKQQSIMRHTVLQGAKEVDAQPVAQLRVQQQQQQQQPTSQQQSAASGPATRAVQQQPAAAARGPSARQRPQVVPPPDKHAREREEVEGPDSGGGDEGASAQPKAYLRRRSAKIQARKVDWSHVQPRTNSRNVDYYQGANPNDYDAILKPQLSPISSPKGAAAAKNALNVNAPARAWTPGGKLPLSPSAAEKAAAAASAAAGQRRVSHIPPAPAGYAAAHQAAQAGAGPVVGSRVRSAGGGSGGGARGGAGGASPLDDLLAHVNTLLRDFDKIVK